VFYKKFNNSDKIYRTFARHKLQSDYQNDSCIKMKEINWIAIFGLYLLCPMNVLGQQRDAIEPQKVAVSYPKHYYNDKNPVCFLLINAVQTTTPSVKSVLSFVNRTEKEWFESKLRVIKGKRFIRPKIIDFPA
jgi:hypothetical protein